MIALKEKLGNFFSLLLETRDTIIQLNKYKGNIYYKNKFLDKVKEINRSFRFLRTDINANANKDLKVKFDLLLGLKPRPSGDPSASLRGEDSCVVLSLA